MEEPVLTRWLAWVMEQSVPRVREVAERLGSPIFGLAGPTADAGVLSGHGSVAARNLYITLRYGEPERHVEITTGSKPLGGTERLVRDVIFRATWGVRLPFDLSVDERLVMVPVLEVPTQFRVVQASVGHWSAAGGYKKRHLRLDGTPGTAPERLALTSVVLP